MPVAVTVPVPDSVVVLLPVLVPVLVPVPLLYHLSSKFFYGSRVAMLRGSKNQPVAAVVSNCCTRGNKNTAAVVPSFSVSFMMYPTLTNGLSDP